MGELEILHQLIQLFEKFKLPYLLTGGYAVTYYGEPRATNDIDFLIEITGDNRKILLGLLNYFSPQYIFQREAILAIVEEETEFNLVHAETGIKIDFWIVSQSDFVSRYKRRQVNKIAGEFVSIISPEDLILNKLFWCGQVFSERHFRDCVGIWQVQKERLDKRYLVKEAKKRGITPLLDDLLKL